MPGRLSVCRIALVEDGERCGEGSVAEIFVKLRELPGREETFVNHRLRRERAEIAALRQKRFGAFAEQSELPLEAGDTTRCVERGDEELPDLGHCFEGAAAERVCVRGDAAPAEDAKALGIGGGFNCDFSLGRCGGWKKGEP